MEFMRGLGRLRAVGGKFGRPKQGKFGSSGGCGKQPRRLYLEAAQSLILLALVVEKYKGSSCGKCIMWEADAKGMWGRDLLGGWGAVLG